MSVSSSVTPSLMSVSSWMGRNKQKMTSKSKSKSKSKSSRRHCSWTRDPEKNKCDLVLQLKRDSGKRDTFYIHSKVLIELDEHRATYFDKVFMESAHRVGDGESLLLCSDEVADVFPLYLDLLYCRSEEEEKQILINVQNGVDLCTVADYFAITSLREMLSKYYRDKTLRVIQPDIEEPTTTTGDFSTNKKKGSGGEFQKKDPIDLAIENFAKAMATNEYVDDAQIEPNFLLKALQRRQDLRIETNSWDSENISCLIALCTQHYTKQLTRGTFYRLTIQEHIPYIDQEAALQLLIVETEEGYWEDTDNFSSVQGRCIRSLLSDWKGLRNKFESDNAFWKTLRRLSPSILSIILMHSTDTALGSEILTEELGQGPFQVDASSTNSSIGEQRDDDASTVRGMMQQLRIGKGSASI